MTTEHNPERILLGCYLLDPQLARLSPLDASHFGADRHGALFDVLRGDAVRRGAENPGPLEVCYWLDAHPEAERNVGGLAYAMQHMDLAVSTQNPEWFEALVGDKYRRRRLATVAVAMHDQQKQGLDVDDVAQQARADLDAMDAGLCSVTMDPNQSAATVLERAQAQYRGETVSYIPTGWPEWDQEFVGLPSEGMVLFLARSGMGKTSLLNSLAVSIASTGRMVHIHGTETSAEGRNEAILYGMAGVDMRYYGELTTRRHSTGLSGREHTAYDEMHSRIAAAAHDRSQLPLYVSGSGLTVERVAAEIRKGHHRGVAVALVDYVQDFPASRAQGLKSDKLSQVPHASGVLKSLSAELRIPIVVAAQVSGEKAGIPNKGQIIPQMWDAQWSSTLHQDAEEVYAINRGDYWQQRLIDINGEAPKAHDANLYGPLGSMGIHARKRRVGALRSVSTQWSGPLRWVGTPWNERPDRAPVNTSPPGERHRDWNDHERDWR